MGSSIEADSSLLYSLGILILSDLTALLKKSPRTLATLESSWKISFPSISVISVFPTPLSEKKDLIVFQKFLLSVTLLGSKFV